MITIVSGLPRSGTSLMMQMLERGGLEVVTDWQRQPDQHNPHGYYELEDVRSLLAGETAWLDKCQGRVVKVVSGLLEYLPSNHHYKVLFMCRPISEVVRSQNKLAGAMGTIDEMGIVSETEIIGIMLGHCTHVQAWLETQSNIEVLYVDYWSVLNNPSQVAAVVDRFLGGVLDTSSMVGAVDHSLSRAHGDTAY